MINVGVRDIRFAEASFRLKGRGVWGWVSCDYGALRLDGLTIRRANEGGYSIGFPRHIDSNGVAHSYFRPLDQPARDAIEAQVIGELRRRGRLR